MKGTRPGSLIAATTISLGALLAATAPIAHAERISENTIKSECKDAGGSYSTQSYGNIRTSSCTYTDIDGDSWTDYYLDGEYEGTDPARRR